VRRVVGALAAALATIVAAGCGTVGIPESGNASSGKQLFTAKCGSCHTLADAGTTGTIGPNLDHAFAESRAAGLGQSTIEAVVRDQIAYAVEHPSTGAPGMPRNLVTGSDADDVAVYVASVAGLPTSGGTTTGGGGATTGGGTTTEAAPPTTTGGGTSTGGGGGTAEGKQIFLSAGCTSCHTLKDAGSTGTVGPNLDDAKPSKDLVVERVTNGKTPMPSFKGQLTDAQIQAVAEYVSSVAGK